MLKEFIHSERKISRAILFIMNRPLIAPHIPDALFLKVNYYFKFGKRLNLKEPKTYNEKLQWFKLYDRKPIYTQLVDKYAVRKYVAEKIGEEYLIPLLGIFNSFKEINFDKLPEKFVLKCTHDSGNVFICTDKKTFDYAKAEEKLEYSLKHNFYLYAREWPYKDVKPRIIAEKYMEDESGELKDYKIFCFNGKSKMLFITKDRQNREEEVKFDFFDLEGRLLPFTHGHPNSGQLTLDKKYFEEMLPLAEKLSGDITQIRVDFYNVKGKIYFGEMTFFHHAGFMPFKPDEWDLTIGQWLKLPGEAQK